MNRISFLHTAAVHVATFDELLANEAVELRHEVRTDWLARVQSEGLSQNLHEDVAALLTQLAADSGAVVCTCSSLGPIAQALALPKVFRIDEPMMLQAAVRGPVLLVVCLTSTIKPSSELLEQAFATQGRAANYQVLNCTDAWSHFEGNRITQFGQSIASSVEQTLAGDTNFGSVVLAQASMSAAMPFLAQLTLPVYSSPTLAVTHALAITKELS